MAKFLIFLMFFPPIAFACDCQAIRIGEGDVYHVSINGAEYDQEIERKLAKLVHERKRVLNRFKGRVSRIEEVLAEDVLFSQNLDKGMFESEIENFNRLQNEINSLKAQPEAVVLPVVKTIRGPIRKFVRVRMSQGCGISLDRDSTYEFTILEENRDLNLSQCNTREVKAPNKVKNEDASEAGPDAA